MKAKNKYSKIHARDYIAALVLILLFGSKLMGMNGIIDSMIALVIGYYFSKRVFEETNCKK